MIFVCPKAGPAEADLLAIELRRSGDADIADLIRVVRHLLATREEVVSDKLQALEDELSATQRENRSLVREVNSLKGEVSRLQPAAGSPPAKVSA